MSTTKTLDTILWQTIQITRVGQFNGTTPKDRNWFTANGDLFVLDFTQTIADIKALMMEVIGEDEFPVETAIALAGHWTPSEQKKRTRDLLRAEQRKRLESI